MGNMVAETYYSERNLQESALDTGIEEDTYDGMCWEASDEDTNTATYHLTSFNKRDIRAKDGIAHYTLSGSTQVDWEPEDDTQTEQSEYGKTYGITTPCSECVEKNLSNVFTSVKDKATEYMWLFLNARVDLLTNSMSDKETAKKKEITKQIATRWTPTRNGIFTWLCVLSTLLCITPVAALPRPPDGNFMNVSSSEYMNLERQHDMNDQGLNCRPQISAKTLPEDIFQKIECETSTCTSVSRIIFEKTGVHSTTEWTPVFEIYNKSYYQPLDTNSEYTLTNRALFSAFPTQHLLYIHPLRLDDRGKWRCVVYDTNNINYTSMSTLEVDYIYVMPTDGNIRIRKHHMEIVTGQETQFTCVVDGVFPKPQVTWEVNNIESFSGISNIKERGDKLWSVKNIVKLSFDKQGANEVTCNIKTDKRNPWMQQKITIDVKESATILIPSNERLVLLEKNSMVNLGCVGSGYRPNVHWTKDGEDILDSDSRYQFYHVCTESECRGFIKANHVDSAFWCVQAQALSGVYTCVISLTDPYNSTKMSPNFNVIMPDLDLRLCSPKNPDVHFGLIVSIMIAAVLVVLVIVTVQLFIMIRGQRAQVTQEHCTETAKMIDIKNDEERGKSVSQDLNQFG